MKALLLAGLVLLLLVPTSAARGASVSSPETRVAPARIPVDLPGRTWRQGMTVPRGHTLVVRRVTLDPRDALTTVMACDARRRIASFGFREAFPFGFRIASGQTPSYVGARRVRVTFTWIERVSPDRRASGSVYLLCRPR